MPSGAPEWPKPRSPAVRDRFRRQRVRDTKPEIELRRALHALGLRYRVDRLVLPGTRRRADIVFGNGKIAVFVDGCFWHGCPLHSTEPKNNAPWWAAKIDGNRARDRDTDQRLAALGWQVERVWEHENPSAAALRIAGVVRRARRSPPPGAHV
jgi:DNA mismatch endonuclease (patch repair protein)